MKRLLFVIGMASGMIHHSCAEQEGFILPKKKSVPSISYEQLCELFGDVISTCTRIHRCLADTCDHALAATRGVLTRNKKNLWVKASKKNRTDTARRIKRLIGRIESLEKDLAVLSKELKFSQVD